VFTNIVGNIAMVSNTSFLYKVAEIALKPAYKIYEKWLWLQIKDGPIPEHVAIIPDGNRRWARKLGLNPNLGHELGYKRLKEVLNWCFELGVKTVTIYALSIDNIRRRPKDEINHLFNLIEKGLKELMSSKIVFKNKVKVKVIGRKNILPKNIVEIAEKLEEKTKNNNEHFLYFAIGYGGREEIVDAVRKLAKKVLEGKLKPDEINENVISKHLYTGDLPKPDPDLIIRTSGEERLSGFLLWQSAYSELYFCDVHWPSFRKIDFWRAIRSYQRRERRFGG